MKLIDCYKEGWRRLGYTDEWITKLVKHNSYHMPMPDAMNVEVKPEMTEECVKFFMDLHVSMIALPKSDLAKIIAVVDRETAKLSKLN